MCQFKITQLKVDRLPTFYTPTTGPSASVAAGVMILSSVPVTRFIPIRVYYQKEFGGQATMFHRWERPVITPRYSAIIWVALGCEKAAT